MDKTLKQVLKEAKEAGYKYLAFSCFDEVNKTSARWSGNSIMGAMGWKNNGAMVFAYPEVNKKGWPPIWDIIRRADIHGGCGNSHQCQIDFSYSKIIGAVRFHLIDGKWKEIPWKYSWKLFKTVLPQIDNEYDDTDIINLAKKKGICDVLTCPFEELPLYINDTNSEKRALAALRIKEGIK